MSPRLLRPLLGVAFVLLLVAFLGLTVAVYRKAFTPVAVVTLHADHTGNQLVPGADVKIRGVIVGRVRAVRTTGDQTLVDLALQPGQLGQIPRNVQARLLPKTLFGERYVALVPPAAPEPAPLRAGDAVYQDRSAQAIEVDRVLADLMPLLRTVRPDQLNATLHALSTALAGRGDQLGRDLVLLHRYLDRLNPELPTVEHDLRALSRVAADAARATPDLAAALDNLQVTNRTLTGQRDLLAALLRSTTELAGTAEPFLAANESRLIRLSAQSRPVLGALAEYAPEYPCFFQGLLGLQPRAERAFGGGQPGLRIQLTVVRDNGKYRPGEEPRNGIDLGPHCYGLPDGAPVPFPVPDLGGRDSSGRLPDGSFGFTGPGTLGRVMTADLGAQGSPAETRAVRALLAPVEGVPPDQVRNTDALLFAPMARGTEVSYR